MVQLFEGINNWKTPRIAVRIDMISDSQVITSVKFMIKIYCNDSVISCKDAKKSQKLHSLIKKAIPGDGFLMNKISFKTINVIKGYQQGP